MNIIEIVPPKCNPIEFWGMFKYVRSEMLPKCEKYSENVCMASAFTRLYWDTSENRATSECQKWCSGIQYVGKTKKSDAIEVTYQEGQHMYGFYLVGM